MLYYLLYPLKDLFSPLNVFQYITFRSAIAAILALIISFILGPVIINHLRKNQIGEQIRKHGPQSHYSKEGTPTMGGLIILLAIILPTLLFADIYNPFVQILVISTIWMGLIGFYDDYLKVVKKRKDGLSGRYKLLAQTILGVFISYILISSNVYGDYTLLTFVPFLKNVSINFFYPIIYAVFIILVVSATSNAVNLTDGLDGLAAGLLAISVSVFGVIAYISGRVDFTDYLYIAYLPLASELTIFATAFFGGCLGFLWFNAKPAEIFMGDVGSLSTGAALGTLAILLKKEVLLLIVGGVFVIETLSVIIQVLYFRYTKNKYGTGKKFFLMAPIHHHFELKGWPESRVVTRFWIIGILFALMSLTTFKVR